MILRIGTYITRDWKNRLRYVITYNEKTKRSKTVYCDRSVTILTSRNKHKVKFLKLKKEFK